MISISGTSRRHHRTGLFIYVISCILHRYGVINCVVIRVDKNAAVSPEDPFPRLIRVTIATNESEIRLDLAKSDSVHPELAVIHLENGFRKRIQRHDLPEVWGYVDIHTGSSLTISEYETNGVIRRSVFGSYRYAGTEYHIEPMYIRAHPDFAHHVYKYKNINQHRRDMDVGPEVASVRVEKRHERRKRRAPLKEAGKRVLWVDLFYATDHKVYDRFYNMTRQSSDRIRTTLSLLKQYFFSVLVGIDMRFRFGFRHPSLVIRSRLVGYATAAYPRDSPWTADLETGGTVDVKASLREFGTRHRTELLQLAQLNETDVDHVAAISGYDVANKGQPSAIGYAYIGTICQRPQYAVSIVEDIGDIVKTTWSMTHEITHTIGARHDALQGGNPECDPRKQYVMTSMLKRLDQRNRNNPWIFSKCSTDFVADYIRQLDKWSNGGWECIEEAGCSSVESTIPKINTFCMRDCSVREDDGRVERIVKMGNNCLDWPSPASLAMTETRDYRLHTSTFFGYIYGPDDQCKHLYGPGAYFARNKVTPDDLICRKMMCYSPRHKADRYHLAAEGTICKSNHWCHQGSCIRYTNSDVADSLCVDSPDPLRLTNAYSVHQLRFLRAYYTCPTLQSLNLCHKVYTTCCKSCRHVTLSNQHLGRVKRPSRTLITLIPRTPRWTGT